MSGYFGYSKSNNAIEAESEFKYPLTVLCRKLGLSPVAVDDYIADYGIDPCEWHHTSKRFNFTHYYDAREFVRSRVIGELTIKYPSVAQFAWRRAVCNELFLEAAHRPTCRDRDYAACRGEEKLAAENARRAEKRSDRIAAKRKSEIEKKKIEEQKKHDEMRKTHKGELRLCCESQGVTAQLIQVALEGEIPTDPCCQISQIRAWFRGWEGTISEAAELGV